MSRLPGKCQAWPGLAAVGRVCRIGPDIGLDSPTDARPITRGGANGSAGMARSIIRSRKSVRWRSGSRASSVR